MVNRSLILIGRTLSLAAILVSLSASLTGCALWSKEMWSIDHFRDDRAVDIDKRLSDQTPIVKNPF